VARGVSKNPQGGQTDPIWPDGSEDENEFATLDVIADQIGTAKGIIMIGNAVPEQEEKLMNCLEKYGAA